MSNHCKGGEDPEYRSKIFMKHRPGLRNYLNRRGVPSGDVEDCLQEVFLLFERYFRPGMEESAGGYLYRIAGSIRNEFWRKHCRAEAAKEAYSFATEICFSPDLAGGTALEQAFNQLCAEDRELIELRFWRELTLEEIGGRFGVVPSTARARIQGVVNRLRQKLL